jgi:glycosyltransferase involved in cell wall biosynthesis
MRVLVLAYPLTPLGPAACGGTEQIAWLVLRELAAEGASQITCLAAPDSRLPGGVNFVSWASVLAAGGLGWPTTPLLSPVELADFQMDCQRALALWLARRQKGFDLIHNQGAYFVRADGEGGAPVLFTLHLAHELYAPDLFAATSRIRWQCVSQTQARGYGRAFPVIVNGVDLGRFRPRRRRVPADAPLVYLGRMCPEKGADEALAIARLARRRLLLVGEPGPFPAHRQYCERVIQPQLGANAQWLRPPTAARKAALLRRAAAVLIPSRIAETSSLVAMEAAACGVPVLALRRGALPEVVAHGDTGWVADSGAELADAARRLGDFSAARCRQWAEEHFDSRRMAGEYAALYRHMAA